MSFFAVLGGLACYFGGTKEIMWLSVVGVVLAALGALASISSNFSGIITTVLIVAAGFIGKKWLASSDNATLAWLYANGGTGFFFITRLAVAVCLGLIGVAIIFFSESIKK